MKLVLIFLVLSVAAIAQAQTPLEEMVKTEQAFSKMAEEKNTQEAFMTFIADDGLLFRPGAANGNTKQVVNFSQLPSNAPTEKPNHV